MCCILKIRGIFNFFLRYHQNQGQDCCGRIVLGREAFVFVCSLKFKIFLLLLFSVADSYISYGLKICQLICICFSSVLEWDSMAKLKKYCKLLLCSFSWEVYANISAKRGQKQCHRCKIAQSQRRERRKKKKAKKKKEIFPNTRNFTDTAFVSGCQSLVFSVHIQALAHRWPTCQ